MEKYKFTKTDNGIDIRRPDGSVLGAKNSMRVVYFPESRLEIKGVATSLPHIYSSDDIEDIDGDAPADNLLDIKLQIEDLVTSVFGIGSGGGGGGGSSFLDPLYFSTGENGIIVLGFRGTDGLAYTYDGENIVRLYFTPAAPTIPVVDDDNNLLLGTPNPEYLTGIEYEGTFNKNADPLVLESVTIDEDGKVSLYVGNRDIDADTAGIRIKAVEGISNASVWMTNPTPFVSQSTTEALVFPFFVSGATGDRPSNVAGQWSNPNGVSYADSVRTANGTLQFLAANQKGRLFSSHNLTEFGYIGLFKTQETADNGAMDFGYRSFHNGPDNIAWKINNVEDSDVIDPIRNHWGIYRNDDMDLILQYSDDATTWVDYMTLGNYTGILYPGLRFDKFGQVDYPMLTKY